VAEHWLRGRVAVVTGASRGIGRATAEAMAGAGAHVILAARSGALLEEVAAGIRENGGAATPAPTDVSRPDEVERLYAIAARGRAPDRAGVRRSGPDERAL